MAEITTDDINVVLATVVGLFPGEDGEANDQKLSVTSMALAALCHSFEVDLDKLLAQVAASYTEMGKLSTRPLTDPNLMRS